MREIVTDSLAVNFFGTRFQMASDSEQRYLAATASLDAAPYRSADVARSYVPRTSAESRGSATR